MASNKKKLLQFQWIHQMPNVWQHLHWQNSTLSNLSVEKNMKGNWKNYFGNDNPITLELACGKGEYTLALAQNNTENNYIGIDMKGNRIWHGANEAIQKKISNVAFIRTQILQLPLFFDTNEISEIWITFCDPFPNKGDEKRRLTSARFLQLYRTICQPNSVFHLKHDDKDFINFTLSELKNANAKVLLHYDNVYENMLQKSIINEVQTFYEKEHLQKQKIIQYLEWQF